MYSVTYLAYVNSVLKYPMSYTILPQFQYQISISLFKYRRQDLCYKQSTRV